MKLIYAGPSTAFTNDASNFLANCIRSIRCERPFLIPLKQFSDLSFYADFPFGKPDSYTITAVDLCGGPALSITTISYIVGQKPGNAWYGVFKDLIGGDTLKTFYLKFVFHIGTDDYIFYSEEFSTLNCDGLMYLQGCYPNEPIGSNATDPNGIYYGYHAGTGTLLGISNVRYFHWAYVRFGKLIDQQCKFSFTLFNSRKTYRTELTQYQVLHFELTPEFYKRHLVGLLSRGNIRINSEEYQLQEEQTFKVGDYDSKLWTLDILLTKLDKLSFGCSASDCQPLPIPPCCTPVITSSVARPNNPQITLVSDVESGDHITRTETFNIGPNVNAGNKFDLTVYGHTVEYIAVAGDTPASVATALRALINATSEASWNSAGSAPPSGTTGFPPVASGSGNNVVIVLDWVHSFAYSASVS
jgi:hypothetical protein